MSDAELIRAVQSGDERALVALYRKYLPAVWRFVYRQVHGDWHVAEDIVSDTFLAALDSIGGLDPEGGSLSGWLLGVARHKLADHRRRLARSNSLRVRVAATGEAIDEVTPLGQLEDRELRGKVARAMDTLSDDERLALEWKYLEGLPVREIADRLGRTERAAEGLLYRARQSFRREFESCRHPVRGRDGD